MSLQIDLNSIGDLIALHGTPADERALQRIRAELERLRAELSAERESLRAEYLAWQAVESRSFGEGGR